MKNFDTPIDWKSEVWWRRREGAERLFHCHIPKSVRANLDKYHDSDELLWDEGHSLLITGPSSSGKSSLAGNYLRNLVLSDGVSGRWVEADDYIEMIKDSFDNEGLLPEMYSTPHLVKYLKGVFDVVVIDGLGEERLTDFAKHELGSLIRKRHDKMKSTIITSSLSLEDIKNRYGDRLATALADFDMESTQ